MKIVMGHVSILHRLTTANRKVLLWNLIRSPFLKFDEKPDIMSTGRSNAVSGDRAIFIARTSKKCLSFMKWKTEDSFTLSGRDLICSKFDYASKFREKIRRRRTDQGNSTDTTRQKSARDNPQHAQPIHTQPRIWCTAQAAKSKMLEKLNAEFLVPKNGPYSHKMKYFALSVLK